MNEHGGKDFIVLTGDRGQYEYWLNSEASGWPNRYVYGHPRNSGMLTNRFHDIIIWGTFWERADATKIYELAQQRLIIK